MKDAYALDIPVSYGSVKVEVVQREFMGRISRHIGEQSRVSPGGYSVIARIDNECLISGGIVPVEGGKGYMFSVNSMHPRIMRSDLFDAIDKVSKEMREKGRPNIWQRFVNLW